MTSYPIISLLDVNVFPLKNDSWLDSPVFAALVGFLLAHAMNIINNYFREKSEMEHYEYLVLRETKDIIEKKSKTKEDLDKFLAKLYTDLRFTKLKSFNMVVDSLNMLMKNEIPSAESKKIDDRLIKISQEGLISKIKRRLGINRLMEFMPKL